MPVQYITVTPLYCANKVLFKKEKKGIQLVITILSHEEAISETDENGLKRACL